MLRFFFLFLFGNQIVEYEEFLARSNHKENPSVVLRLILLAAASNVQGAVSLLNRALGTLTWLAS